MMSQKANRVPALTKPSLPSGGLLKSMHTAEIQICGSTSGYYGFMCLKWGQSFEKYVRYFMTQKIIGGEHCSALFSINTATQQFAFIVISSEVMITTCFSIFLLQSHGYIYIFELNMHSEGSVRLQCCWEEG